MLISEKHLLSIVDAYAGATGKPDTAISSRVFDDGKKIEAMRTGSTITVRRLNDALRWFSANWPDNADWPADIARPEVVPPPAPANDATPSPQDAA